MSIFFFPYLSVSLGIYGEISSSFVLSGFTQPARKAVDAQCFILIKKILYDDDNQDYLPFFLLFRALSHRTDLSIWNFYDGRKISDEG